MSNNKNRTELLENLATPEPVINTSDGVLDAALTEVLTVDVTADNASVSASASRVQAIIITGAAVARDVTFTAAKRRLNVFSDDANVGIVTLICGATEHELNPGDSCVITLDGTTDGMIVIGGSSGGGGATDLSFSTFVAGKPGASEKLMRFKTAKPFTLPIGLTGSQYVAEVAATADTVFTLLKNGSSIGTLTFAASGTVPTVSFTSAVSFVAGDVFGLNAPGTADSTLADIAFTFLGSV